MDLQAIAELGHSPERAFIAVSDLATYPRWLSIVGAAEPAGDGVWLVDLQAGIGPIRRTKRLRMVRTINDPPRKAAFERDEADGQKHGAWELTADLAPSAAGTRLTMHLFYDGGGWIPGLDVILRREIRGAGDRLASYLSAST